MSRSIRRAMIDRDHQQLSLVRQCILLDVSRASVYYRPVPTRAEDLELMALMDRQYLKTPFYGSRKMKAWLLQQGYLVSRKRVRRLMRLMGLGHLPASQHQQTSAGTPDLSLSASGRPGLGRGHHLHPHGEGLPVPGGHHGLAQPARAGLEALQHRHQLLRGGVGGSPG